MEDTARATDLSPLPGAGTWRLVLADYLNLAKPRAVALIVITAVAAMVIAQGGWPPAGLVLATLVGGGLVTAGANALNCFLDRDIDGLMARTAARPLPAGRLKPWQALVFGLSLSALGLVMLLVWVNRPAALLALAANAFYVLGYTGYLKRRTAQNIVIGGAAGAASPLIGYAAVAGGVDLTALGLAVFVLCWTPPHFWSLALLRADEYRHAGVPMLPVVLGVAATRQQIVRYAVLAGVAALLPVAAGPLRLFYAAVAVALSLGLIAFALRLNAEPAGPRTRELFRYSVVYLALVCLAMVLEVAVF